MNDFEAFQEMLDVLMNIAMYIYSVIYIPVQNGIK